MKVLSLLLAVLILLTGCAREIPEPAFLPQTCPAETQPPETEPPETLPPETEPRDPLTELLEKMPLEHKVGQLFLARCPQQNALEDVKTFHLGGYILFSRDLLGQIGRD